jgi:hypothetical protein
MPCTSRRRRSTAPARRQAGRKIDEAGGTYRPRRAAGADGPGQQGQQGALVGADLHAGTRPSSCAAAGGGTSSGGVCARRCSRRSRVAAGRGGGSRPWRRQYRDRVPTAARRCTTWSAGAVLPRLSARSTAWPNPVLLGSTGSPDLTSARRRLRMFLVRYWGGPTTYSDWRNHPRLQLRRIPFRIGPGRDRWLGHGRAIAVARQLPTPRWRSPWPLPPTRPPRCGTQLPKDSGLPSRRHRTGRFAACRRLRPWLRKDWLVAPVTGCRSRSAGRGHALLSENGARKSTVPRSSRATARSSARHGPRPRSGHAGRSSRPHRHH